MKTESIRMMFFKNWDTSLKIPSMFFLMMSMAFIRDSTLMPVLPVIALVLFVSSGLPLSLLLSRFRAPVLILLFVSVFLILFSGEEVLIRIGPVSLKSVGVILALNTCVRVLSVITVGIVMVNTTPLSGLSGKLKRMRIPHLLVDIGVMTGRYIMVIGEDYSRMKTARKLRGYIPGMNISRRFKVIIPTAATMLIRGFDQSERVFNAMCMRGYGSGISEKENGSFPIKTRRLDVLVSLAVVATSLFIIILEFTVETV